MDKSRKGLAHHLKKIRLVARVSQYSVSIGTGIDRSRLSSIENGYVSPRPDEVKQIERFISTVQCQQVARLKKALATTPSGPAPLWEGKAGGVSILHKISGEGALEK